MYASVQPSHESTQLSRPAIPQSYLQPPSPFHLNLKKPFEHDHLQNLSKALKLVNRCRLLAKTQHHTLDEQKRNMAVCNLQRSWYNMKPLTIHKDHLVQTHIVYLWENVDTKDNHATEIYRLLQHAAIQQESRTQCLQPAIACDEHACPTLTIQHKICLTYTI